MADAVGYGTGGGRCGSCGGCCLPKVVVGAVGACSFEDEVEVSLRSVGGDQSAVGWDFRHLLTGGEDGPQGAVFGEKVDEEGALSLRALVVDLRQRELLEGDVFFHGCLAVMSGSAVPMPRMVVGAPTLRERRLVAWHSWRMCDESDLLKRRR